MAGSPGAEGERRISSQDLERHVGLIFEKCAMNTADAVLLTETLVAADLRGCHLHDVLRVPD